MNRPKKKIGRNDPCHCNSGKKYKKCCLRVDEEKALLEREKSRVEGNNTRPARDRLTEGRGIDGDPGELDASNTNIEDWKYEDNNEYDFGIEKETVENRQSWCNAPVRSYAKPDPIPDATPEVDAIVEAWWDEFMPVYRKRDLHSMNRMMDEFIEEHPDKVPHLHLHDECLLEWSAAMCKEERHEELIEKLFRIREDFPIVYDQVFQYLDLDLAEALVIVNRKGEISRIVDRYAVYPDTDCDYLAKLVDLLLVTNLQDEVFALARATAVPCACSSGVMGYGPTLRWLEFEAAIPAFERRESSDEAALLLIKAYEKLELPFEHGLTQDDAKIWLADMFTPTDRKVFAEGTKSQQEGAIRRLCYNLAVWLHDSRYLTWASATYFCNLLLDYYLDNSENRELMANPLLLKEKDVEAYICSHFRDFFHINGTKALSLLQAFWFLASFLRAVDQWSREPLQLLENLCINMYGNVKKALAPTEPAKFLFHNFPEYRFAVD